MTGLCIAAGRFDTTAAIKRMAGRLFASNQSLGKENPTPSLAIANSWHAGMTHMRAPVTFDDGLVCAVSGEIFDDYGLFKEPEQLIADLYKTGHLHKTAWLNGSFRIGLLDPKQNRVILITDRLGSKSIFVWHNDKALIASSRLDAVIREDIVRKRLSRQGLTELLIYQRTVASQTQYSDIESMTAAQIWVWENGTLTKKTARKLAWVKPDFSKTDAAEGLASALTRATERRLSDPVRHGLLMSGGLDSRAVLAAAHRSGKPLSCATVSAWENMEVALARRSAEVTGADFKLHNCTPEGLAAAIKPSTEASDGLFSAPVNLYSSLPDIAHDHDVMLSGHGLDYTLRGYYLPCRTLKLAGSTTRLPRLRQIQNWNPETIANSLRVGISPAIAKQILRPDFAAEIDTRRIAAMEAALADIEIEDDYNGWDAFILHSLGRHYAYSDFVAIEEVIHHRSITFDPVVFDLYLSMPPAWRAEGKVAHDAMNQISPDLMRLADANTGLSARYGFSKQIFLILMRAILRRTGLIKRPVLPNPSFTHGSWMDAANLFRHNETWRTLALSLPDDPVLNAMGLFQQDGLRVAVSGHMSGKANHKKLLMQLLTLSSWFSEHPFEEVGA